MDNVHSDNSKIKVSLRISPELRRQALEKYSEYNFTFTQIVELALLKLIKGEL